jgi:hypothetical protein
VLTEEEAELVQKSLVDEAGNYHNICCQGPDCLGELVLPSGLEGAALVVEDHAEFSIEASGYYSVLAFNCQMTTYTLTGTVDVINPYGYVPGEDGVLLLVRST